MNILNVFLYLSASLGKLGDIPSLNIIKFGMISKTLYFEDLYLNE